MGSERPLAEPAQPGADAEPDPAGAAAAMPPKGVGESVSRRGEDLAEREGKESGRDDTGTDDAAAGRPVGHSDLRDKTSVDPNDIDSSEPA
jgi:hypothetical protein